MATSIGSGTLFQGQTLAMLLTIEKFKRVTQFKATPEATGVSELSLNMVMAEGKSAIA